MSEFWEIVLWGLLSMAIGLPLSIWILSLIFGIPQSGEVLDDYNFSQGKYRTRIVGIQHRIFVSKLDVGIFKGQAVAKTNNKHDPYAVAIYNSRGKHLGYVSKGHIALHTSIIERGGSVYCAGFLREGDINSNVILGEVYIDFDPSRKINTQTI